MQHESHTDAQLRAELQDIDFHAAFRASPDILLLLAPDFTMLDASDARLAMTRTTRAETVGRYLFDVFPDNPDNEGAVGKTNLHASLVRVRETRERHEMALQRYDLLRPDGTFEERYWRPLNVPVLGPDGAVRYIIHRVEDATSEVRLRASEAERERERREAQRAQEVAIARLNGVLEAAKNGIALLEAIRDDQGGIVDFRILLFNRAGQGLVGKSGDEVLGTTALGNWPSQRATGIFDLYVRVVETGVPDELEVRYEADGLAMWVHLTAVRVGDGVAVTFTDVTENKTSLIRIASQIAELRQADEMKDQFLGILSHELRTPINAIMGFGSILADGLAGDLTPEQATYMGKILDATDALLGLVNDLLDMSRVQAGKFALDLRTVEIAPLIWSTLAGLAVQAIKKGLSVVNAIPANLPTLRADPQRVRQVLENLVANAIKYTPEGGTITVHGWVDGRFLRVEVADTGLGISPAQQARIFEAFTQVDMTNTRARGGVGLGLSIVKGLVEAHGGEVGVMSAGVGSGSRFWFTLPLEAGPD